MNVFSIPISQEETIEQIIAKPVSEPNKNYTLMTYPDLVEHITLFSGSEEQIVESAAYSLKKKYSKQELLKISNHIEQAIPDFKLWFLGFKKAKIIAEIGKEINYEFQHFKNVMSICQNHDSKKLEMLRSYLLNNDAEEVENSFYRQAKKISRKETKELLDSNARIYLSVAVKQHNVVIKKLENHYGLNNPKFIRNH